MCMIPLRKRRVALIGVLAGACLLQSAELSLATTTTTTFTVSITLTATCTITSASALNFGSAGILNTAIPQTSTINVICSSGTGYNIGLDAGTGSGATVAARKMTNSSNTVTYSLYRDAGHTQVWGTTIGTDTVSATGDGLAAGQNYTVYGLVPAQTTPPASSGGTTYSDTITVTVTY
jgi:spore coat protein U domain-containing protein, fimbrial subunit CupE1/2/3/6